MTANFELVKKETGEIELLGITFSSNPVPAGESMTEPPPNLKDMPPNWTHCRACGMPQFVTPHGVVCENGHGGAGSLEDN